MTAAQARQVLQANAVFDLAAGSCCLRGPGTGCGTLSTYPRASRPYSCRSAARPWWARPTCCGRRRTRRPCGGPSRSPPRAPTGWPRWLSSFWLVTGLPDDVDTLGTVLLIALVVVLGAFAALKARVARAPESDELERK